MLMNHLSHLSKICHLNKYGKVFVLLTRHLVQYILTNMIVLIRRVWVAWDSQHIRPEFASSMRQEFKFLEARAMSRLVQFFIVWSGNLSCLIEKKSIKNA